MMTFSAAVSTLLYLTGAKATLWFWVLMGVVKVDQFK